MQQGGARSKCSRCFGRIVTRRRVRERQEMLGARKFAIRGARRAQIKRRAREYGRTFAIDGMVLEVPTCRPLSGSPLDGRASTHMLTIDRIDNTRGYEPNNVWTVSHRANAIKRGANLEVAKLRLA